MNQLYDTIGGNYDGTRRPDPFWAKQIRHRLGSVGSIVNIGAGTGSYEPKVKKIIAVEPSLTMIKQRSLNAAPAVQAIAEALPFRDESFSVAISVLSSHHWRSRSTAFQEIGRVATQKAVFVTWDPGHDGFWLTQDYFPEIVEIDRRIFPPVSEFEHAFGRVGVFPLLIPHDCIDGFLGAYWRRPYAYLNKEVREGMSTFAKLSKPADGLARLHADLESGEWLRKHCNLLQETVLDLGYRIVVANVA